MKNILTIDVEELFQTEYCRESKVEQIYRAHLIIPEILNLLDKHETKATFFIVGNLAEKYPWIIKEIVRRGHEVGFHSYDHKRMDTKDPKLFEKEIDRFDEILRSEAGVKCLGFRAPSFSIGKGTKWLIPLLEKKGFAYDSSVFPSWTPLYGSLKASTKPYILTTKLESQNTGQMWEFPLVVYSFLKIRFPASGGFYLRAWPNLVKKAIRRSNRAGRAAVIYVHSWEFDVNIQRPKVNLFKSFVTFHNLSKVTKTMEILFKEFEFTSVTDYMKANELIAE